MNTQLDVHTHTIVSGHAYSTLQEMVYAAKEKKLKLLGITEHGPALDGACHPMYFKNLSVIPRCIDGVELMIGAEMNIMNTNGDLDLDMEDIDRLDLRIAGIHSCYVQGTTDENTNAMISAIKNPEIDIISHPADGCATLLLEPVVIAAKEAGTLLEINNSSLRPDRKKEHAAKLNSELLNLCKKYNLPVILGSDAHISYSIADYEYALKLISENNFPEDLIVNDKIEIFKEIINKKKAGRHCTLTSQL